MSLNENKITLVECPTWQTTIYIAGDYSLAKNELSRMATTRGMCASMWPCDYVYSGGLESGVAIRIINCPRFPANSWELRDLAEEIARELIVSLHRHLFVRYNETQPIRQSVFQVGSHPCQMDV